jgi:hypothetical protein
VQATTTTIAGLAGSNPICVRTRMTTLAFGFIAELDTGATVYNTRLFDDQTIVVQFLNITTTVRQRNFVDFVRVEPNLALAALEHVGRQPLLQFE